MKTKSTKQGMGHLPTIKTCAAAVRTLKFLKKHDPWQSYTQDDLHLLNTGHLLGDSAVGGKIDWQRKMVNTS